MNSKKILSNFLNDFGIDDKLNIDYEDIDKFLCQINNLEIKKNSSLFFAGTPLLDITHKPKPSLKLLEIIKKKTNSIIKLNSKSSWLFICGRDILKKGILEKNKINNKAIVLNEKEEIIGVAQKLIGRDFYKNYWNIGDFLKREN